MAKEKSDAEFVERGRRIGTTMELVGHGRDAVVGGAIISSVAYSLGFLGGAVSLTTLALVLIPAAIVGYAAIRLSAWGLEELSYARSNLNSDIKARDRRREKIRRRIAAAAFLAMVLGLSAGG